MIIRRFSQLLEAYHTLRAGDLYIGQVPATPLRAAMLIDLESRGIRLLPSAAAHMINASKTAQALLMRPWMLPHTCVITRRRELLDAVTRFHRAGVTKVVTKADALHCGHGVRKWNDLEMLYNCISVQTDPFPFVMQPFIEMFTDVRVILVGDFCEAYSRCNPHGFRMNLAMGGESRPFALSGARQAFCRRLLRRGRMPFAHIDLMITADEACYLSEIRLNGGIHGAEISRERLDDLKRNHLEVLARQSPASGTKDQGCERARHEKDKEGGEL